MSVGATRGLKAMIYEGATSMTFGDRANGAFVKHIAQNGDNSEIQHP